MPVITHRLFLTFCLIFLAVGVSSHAWAAAPSSTPSTTPATTGASVPGTKLATDQILREEMQGIADFLDKQGITVAGAQLTGSAYKEIAVGVDARLANIAKNSQLTPKSDKAWQAVRADIKFGLELMRSEKLPLQEAGALALIQAVRNYGKHFDHPGFKL